MHTKKVNECAVTSERSVFRIANSNVMNNHVYSTLNKRLEKKSDRRSKETEQRKKHKTHTHTHKKNK